MEIELKNKNEYLLLRKELIRKKEYNLKKKIGHLLFHKILMRIKEYDKENLQDMTYLMCPNHTSDLDGPILWSSNNNMRIMAKKECFENQIRASFLRSIDIVSVDRDKRNGAEIKEAVRYLEADDKKKIFIMFPQGTISDINKYALARILPGAFVISALSNTPIVPVFMEQPRFFRRSRIVYGKPYLPDIPYVNG